MYEGNVESVVSQRGKKESSGRHGDRKRGKSKRYKVRRHWMGGGGEGTLKRKKGDQMKGKERVQKKVFWKNGENF